MVLKEVIFKYLKELIFDILLFSCLVSTWAGVKEMMVLKEVNF